MNAIRKSINSYMISFLNIVVKFQIDVQELHKFQILYFYESIYLVKNDFEIA